LTKRGRIGTEERAPGGSGTPIPETELDPEAYILAQVDPTDHALATIASILDMPERRREPEKTAVAEQASAVPPPLPAEPAPVVAAPVAVAVTPAPIEAHGYARHGPGPMAAIRFKWTVRLENGDYFVDETIGENSTPIASGPLSREAAIQMVDDRESDARRRFEQLKSEMSGRSAAHLAQRNSVEA
jgi:hypothetical protein